MTRAPLNRWWVKAAAQGALAAAPRAAALDDALRRRMRGAYLSEDYFLSKWRHVTQHLRALGNPGDRPLLKTRAVEIGTGWFPIVPLGLAVHGGTVVTIDTGQHLDAARVRLAMQRLSQLEAAGTITAASPERMARLRELLLAPPPSSAAQLLEPMGIRPVIADAQDLSQVPEAHGSNLLVSNNTLEHIPAEILAGIFREFLRVGSKSARMSHYIDLADHYAGFDPRITEFHFLTMSPTRWRLTNNRLGFQNRLRIGDYRELLSQTGWRVTREKLTRRPTRSLDGLRLVPPYDQVPIKELLVVKAHLVTTRA
ncbi:class I SAM-dependent methyltransferase [Ornithinimicrobium cryptoxanthini]|uniref:Class I SAM-dependent methyltransferase n=1 Tax=Ornithinimicrobium cryptoxanthini TaxID=2934161 RepID=A0ABY4YFJ4_9MICO|nr:class I SAM-dependent methyltransferase [Ornithinimicrobium cryptoxanthini]USQ75306.1 class I SAM-dependent methyltransferase [Ornithinimicrobium cryptoxanthini]